MEKRKRKRKRLILILVVFVLLIAVGTGLYLLDYYHASETAMSELNHPTVGVEIIRADDKIIFEPESAQVGLIFYPGGKVAFESYAPLLESCAENGILCVLCRCRETLLCWIKMRLMEFRRNIRKSNHGISPAIRLAEPSRQCILAIMQMHMTVSFCLRPTALQI